MFLTNTRKKIMEIQTEPGTRKILAERHGITVAHIHVANSAIYNDIIEALEVFDENYPVFERRIVRDSEKLKSLILRLNRKINDSLRA